MKRLILFSLTLLLLLSAFDAVTHAQTMINEDYRIQMGDLNSTTDEPENNKQQVENTPDDKTPGLYEGNNYKVKSGFQYIPGSFPFSFSISNTNISLGDLNPTNPITRTTILTVTNTETDGFNVSAAENHELTEPNTGAIIPDTTCDDGNCSESTASMWVNTLTYGFGYRCDRVGATCVEGDNSFQNKDYFKHFPNSSKDESAVSAMSGRSGLTIKSTIIYKVNISSSQPAGTYSNTVTYLATPNY